MLIAIVGQYKGIGVDSVIDLILHVLGAPLALLELLQPCIDPRLLQIILCLTSLMIQFAHMHLLRLQKHLGVYWRHVALFSIAILEELHEFLAQVRVI